MKERRPSAPKYRRVRLLAWARRLDQRWTFPNGFVYSGLFIGLFGVLHLGFDLLADPERSVVGFHAGELALGMLVLAVGVRRYLRYGPTPPRGWKISQGDPSTGRPEQQKLVLGGPFETARDRE